MALQAFSVDRVTDQRSAQVMNPVNKNGLYRGPTQEKNYLLLAGIEPGSHSCESDVLPLDHGLPLTTVLLFASQLSMKNCRRAFLLSARLK